MDTTTYTAFDEPHARMASRGDPGSSTLDQAVPGRGQPDRAVLIFDDDTGGPDRLRFPGHRGGRAGSGLPPAQKPGRGPGPPWESSAGRCPSCPGTGIG
ncbi:MAG: hypothetical protein MZU95_08680 [Desulfomicrobium escambiense]|nr:hypothetical protein [Desulfomicrobium escambiense]